MALRTLGIALAGLASGCESHDDPRSLIEAQAGIREVIALIEAGELTEARQRLGEADASLHETATLVEAVNPETAEVINDITEYLKRRLESEDADSESLLDTAGRALAWLETTHFDLENS